MQTIYDNAIEAVRNGASFTVDFKQRALKIDGKNVSLEGELGIPKFDNLDQWLDEVEDRYDTFRYSNPTEKSSSHHDKYFEALTVEELGDSLGRCSLASDADRMVSLAELEVFILLSLIDGQFDPEELFNRDFFYQCPADQSFVMWKEWF